MSKEEEFVRRWSSEEAAYLAWGQHISDEVTRSLDDLLQPIATSHFLKTAVVPRTKDAQKLLEKAFYRNKNYQDPYGDVTDKVGTRFVVLLGRDIRTVERALQALPGLSLARDRDYEQEQALRPLTFEYAAVHYIVRPNEALNVGGLHIPAGTPCEVQIKTLLQHAYSELTHDTIYKPQINATPAMQRNAAKSMALLEATNDYFEKVADEVTAALSSVRDITSSLTAVYKEITGLDAKPSLLEGLLLEAYEADLPQGYDQKVRDLLTAKPFIAERIKERVARQSPLFIQPSILLAYLDVSRRGERAIANWPLTPSEFEPVLNDLGESRH